MAAVRGEMRWNGGGGRVCGKRLGELYGLRVVLMCRRVPAGGVAAVVAAIRSHGLYGGECGGQRPDRGRRRRECAVFSP